MPRFDYTFEIKDAGTGDKYIMVADGYDPAISLSINHDHNWSMCLIRAEDGSYTLDLQIGNHNAILMDVDRDGLRGVDEDGLEVTAKGRYPIRVLSAAIRLVDAWSHKIIYAMESLYQAANAA